MGVPMPVLQCLVWLLAALLAVHGQSDECEMRDGSAGLCKPIKECLQASEFILNGGSPKVCSFKNRAPIICCGTFPTHGHPSRPAVAPLDIDDATSAPPTSRRPTYKTTYYFLTIFKTTTQTTPMTTTTTTQPSTTSLLTTTTTKPI